MNVIVAVAELSTSPQKRIELRTVCDWSESRP